MSLSKEEKEAIYVLLKDLGSFGVADDYALRCKGSLWRIKEETIGDDGRTMLRFVSEHDERVRIRIYPEQVEDYFIKA